MITVLLGILGVIALGMAFFGLKTAAFGSGYPLVGGRESFGWGSRLAGMILVLPLLGLIVFLVILLADRERAQYILQIYQALILAVAGGGFVLLFAISYGLAEFTHMPYWAYLQSKESQEEAEPEERLTSKEKRKKQSKLEKKLERARLREEQKRRELEEEQERLKRRHEDVRTRRAPPPIPDEEDDGDDRRGRRY